MNLTTAFHMIEHRSNFDYYVPTLKQSIQGTSQLDALIRMIASRAHYNPETGNLHRIKYYGQKAWDQYVSENIEELQQMPRQEVLALRSEVVKAVPGERHSLKFIGTGNSPYHRIAGVMSPTSHFVWLINKKELPPKRITHLDGNVFNDRIENLAPHEVKSALPFQCVVLHEGRQYHLGRFATREEVVATREAFKAKKRLPSWLTGG
jgi:hypothetical protein